MVIYIDVLLVLNGWIDYLLLRLVRRFTGISVKPWRLAIGAVLGAASSLSILLPSLYWMLPLAIKFMAALGMIRVAFPWKNLVQYIRQALLLFVLSALFAGLCCALYYFVAPEGFYIYNGVVYYDVSPLLLVGLVAVCYCVLSVAEAFLGRCTPSHAAYYVTIHWGGYSIRVRCLYDSGNRLREPFSNLPVLVVERTTAEKLLSVPRSAEELPSQKTVLWRLIPFDSLGGEGTLLAFRPEMLTVKSGTRERQLPDCYVAVCERLGRGDFEGLIGCALLEELV